jgi:hypothetical protein
VLDESSPLFARAGIWRRAQGVIRASITSLRFCRTILCVRAKAMAVLLTAAEEWDTLLAGSADKPSLYKRHCRTKCSDRVRSEDLNRFKNRAKRSGYGAFEKCRNVRSSLAIRCTAD